jgi:homoserine O-succinyltransferase
MPVCFNSNQFNEDQWTGAKWPFVKPAATAHSRSNRSISIGLINNMSDGAIGATERQFLSLLDSASDGIEIRLSLYSLPGVPRSESGARYVKNFYSSAENLWNTRLDGLIVTGTALQKSWSGPDITLSRLCGHAWLRMRHSSTWMALEG